MVSLQKKVAHGARRASWNVTDSFCSIGTSPASPKKAVGLGSSLLIVRSILHDTLKMQRYDRFLTYKEQMSKFIKKKE